MKRVAIHDAEGGTKYRDFDNKVEPTSEQKAFSRWVNRKNIFKSVAWKDYTRKVQRHVGQLALEW